MERTKYGYAESSGLKSTIAGHIYSIQNDSLAIENGTLWKKGNIKTNKEIYSVEKPAKGDKVVLALSALYAYDTTTTLGQHEMFLRKEAGEVARAYEVGEDDRYAVADYMVTPATTDTAPVKDNYIVYNDASGAKTEYKEIASTGSVEGYGFVAVIEEVEYKSNLTLVRLRVIRNENITAAATGH